MLFALAVLLLFLWVIGMTSGLAVGAWIHLLLVAALLSAIAALFYRQAGSRAEIHGGGGP